jgi:hypothetical protein
MEVRLDGRDVVSVTIAELRDQYEGTLEKVLRADVVGGVMSS